MWKFSTWIILCLVLIARIHSSTRSEWSVENPFGITTSYFTVTDIIKDLPSVDGCSPATMWMLARHGSRNPDIGILTNMKEKLPELRDKMVKAWEEGRGSMLEKDIGYMKKWNGTLLEDDEDAKMLTDNGRLEQRLMGHRWRTRLPHFFNDSDKVKVRAAKEQRCIDSAGEFLKGAFDTTNRSLLPNIKIDNHLVNFFKKCTKFVEKVKNNNKRQIQTQKLWKSKSWEAMTTRVIKKSGVKMDFTEMQLLWNMCSFERSKAPWCQYPAWCSVFTMDDMKLWQFSKDLEYYYTYGYGSKEITHQMTQPLFEDLFSHFNKLVSNTTNLKSSILNFGHDSTVQTLLSALGLFRDDHNLLASDWPDNYSWETSKIVPFAANIEIILYQCQAEDYKVMMLHNEKMMKQPACGDNLCSLKQFTKFYRYYSIIDFDQVCNN